MHVRQTEPPSALSSSVFAQPTTTAVREGVLEQHAQLHARAHARASHPATPRHAPRHAARGRSSLLGICHGRPDTHPPRLIEVVPPFDEARRVGCVGCVGSVNPREITQRPPNANRPPRTRDRERTDPSSPPPPARAAEPPRHETRRAGRSQPISHDITLESRDRPCNITGYDIRKAGMMSYFL